MLSIARNAICQYSAAWAGGGGLGFRESSRVWRCHLPVLGSLGRGGGRWLGGIRVQGLWETLSASTQLPKQGGRGERI